MAMFGNGAMIGMALIPKAMSLTQAGLKVDKSVFAGALPISMTKLACGLHSGEWMLPIVQTDCLAFASQEQSKNIVNSRNFTAISL
jgi:hypothetical protein